MSRSTRWFLVIVMLLILSGAGAWMVFSFFLMNPGGYDREILTGNGDKIALIELNGVILNSGDIVRQFKKFREDRSIKGILFRVDSPGGGVAASQEISEEVRKTKNSGKPVVVSMGALAASGGYYVSCPANKIVANRGTLTGSIGVISQFMQYDSLLGKIGVSVNIIKSGRYKDAGNPFRSMTSDDRSYFQDLMDDVHRQFISVVETERKLLRDSVEAYADGRVFTGEQAVTLGLIDTLGTYEDALAITARLSRIKGKPSIVKERRPSFSLLDRILGRTEIDDLMNLKDKLLNQPILQYRMTHGF